MQSDSGTQFALAFGPEEIELKPGSDAVLYANFFLLDRDFVVGYSESVKGRKRKSGDLIVGSNFDELDLTSLLDDVRERYSPSKEISTAMDALEDRVLSYARALPQVFSVDESFLDTDGYCECHGRGTDPGLRGFYGPALKPGGSPSLALELHRGCEIVDSFYGDPKDGAAKVLGLIDSALATGDDEFGLKAIARFRRSLVRVLPSAAS